MWGFDFWLGGEYLPQYPAYPISVHDRGTVRFLPSPDGAYIWAPGYSDEFSADSKTIFDSNGLRDGYAEMKGWGGETPFVITSLPDPTDNSTWTWVLNLYGHGPTLHVPDYSNSGLCLAFAAGLLLFFQAAKGEGMNKLTYEERGKSPELLGVRLRGIPARKLSGWHHKHGTRVEHAFMAGIRL